ncbi:hypothetical protein [Sporolactobacillus laevolacticus]|uniref:Uncharacterized protein n=1 Tax=Sporolactobacillus laevolacticus DSM 442 TaxID=1395513 RepID=V6IXD1_9BACL|nr:hypothetical protein [Sporolactobacillus laevolacticus]EST11992.1 hypothetical protein P343_09840 [Sporolactobacillus laevolacticus DSM 442]
MTPIVQSFILGDLIFPVFMFPLFPTLFALAALLNLPIDALVQFVVLRFMHVKLEREKWFHLLLKLWGIGLLADVIGSILLTGIMFTGLHFDPYDFYTSLFSTSIFFTAILLSALVIYAFDFRVLKKSCSLRQAKRIALAFAIFTAPYTFLISTSWVM